MDLIQELQTALKNGIRTGKFGWVEEAAIKHALYAFDNLQTQSIREVTPGMVGIPEVEWDAIFKEANPQISGGTPSAESDC